MKDTIVNSSVLPAHNYWAAYKMEDNTFFYCRVLCFTVETNKFLIRGEEKITQHIEGHYPCDGAMGISSCESPDNFEGYFYSEKDLSKETKDPEDI